jgi:hypothetical protein
MKVCSLHTSIHRSGRTAWLALIAAFVALVVPVLAGCGPGGGSNTTTQLPTPTLNALEIPDNNNWSTHPISNQPAEVLPTRGRGVRLVYSAPFGSVFAVSLRELDPSTMASVTTPLTQNYGTPAPPDAGYFQILNETASSPAVYHMYVRAPASLMTNPMNFDILVVNHSLRTDQTDSTPMVVSLRARKVFTVTVTVAGDGHVTSSPSGIVCGTSPSGRELTPCTADFGPGQVTLHPGSNDLSTTRFLGWTGNCPGNVQSCVLNLDGSGRSLANATFVATSSSETASTQPAAPTVPGWRWIGIPGCGRTDMPLGATVQWDAQG